MRIGDLTMSECVRDMTMTVTIPSNRATVTVRRNITFRIRSYVGIKLMLLGGYVFGFGRVIAVTTEQGD